MHPIFPTPLHPPGLHAPFPYGDCAQHGSSHHLADVNARGIQSTRRRRTGLSDLGVDSYRDAVLRRCGVPDLFAIVGSIKDVVDAEGVRCCCCT